MEKLAELIMKMINEQRWREIKAQKMSSGLGSLPYSFGDQMNLQYPGFMDALQRQGDTEEHMYRGYPKDTPDWFPERYELNEMLKGRRYSVDKKNQGML